MSFLKLLAVPALAVLLSGCCCKDSYEIAFLGDIHYDRTDLHDAEVYKNFNPKVPYSKGVVNKDGIFSWRSQTMWATESLGSSLDAVPLNVKMWEKEIPALLDAAAETAGKRKVSYLFQLGDIVHGDAGRYDLHSEMLKGGLNALTSRFDCPVLAVIGNHDTRGPGGLKAWREIMESVYDSNVRNITRKNSNFYFEMNGDVYFFYDLLNPDLELLETAVNIPSRYFFFLSHVPVIPAESARMRHIITDDTERLLSLLLKRNAIVLSGHTHDIALYRYRNTKNPVANNTITQFIINSTLRYPEKRNTFKQQVIFSSKNNNSKQQQALWDKLFAGKIDVKLLTEGSGYGILRVSDDGVFVDYYNIDSELFTFPLRTNAK